jgi:hypothetical protein
MRTQKHLLVCSSTTTGDSTNRKWNFIFLELVGAKYDSMCIGGSLIVAPKVIIFLLKSLQSNLRNLIEALDLVFSGLVAVDITVSFPLTAAMFDFDRNIRKCTDCRAYGGSSGPSKGSQSSRAG